MRELRDPAVRSAVGLWAIAAAAFHLYSIAIGLLDSRYQRAIHFLFILPLAFLVYPARAKSPRDRPSAGDWLLAAASAAVNAYLVVFADRINLRWEGVSWPSGTELLVGTLAIGLTIEAARRAAGAALSLVTLGFVAWLLACSYVYAASDAGLAVRYARLVEILFLFQGEGLYGNLLGVAATYIALFVLLGAFIEKTGAAAFFTDLARLAVGRARGGAGKIAALSSALFGTVVGQGTANVYTTGSFTIPLMKKAGYSAELAAGIEASASMGGALLPPVMGTAAFVMADFLGMSMSALMKRALLPAILYFAAILLVVHLEAAKRGGAIAVEDGRPSWRLIARRAYVMTPLLVLVGALIGGYSALLAGLMAIGVALLVCLVQTRDARRFSLLVRDSLVSGTRNTVMVSISCACAGIVVASVAYSGLAVMFGTAVISLAEESLPAVLTLTMLVTLVLGTGLPATPSYILTVSLLAPSLAVLGLEAVQIHLFVFYFAILSDVTPPVCLTTYAAAGIAGAQPMKAGLEGLKLSFAGFLVPFLFIGRPGLTLSGPWLQVLADLAIAMLVVCVGAVSLTGWARTRLSLLERSVLLAAAIGLLDPAPAAFRTGSLLLAGAGLLVTARLVHRRRLSAGVQGGARRSSD